MRAAPLLALLTTGCAMAITPDGGLVTASGAARATHCQSDQTPDGTTVQTCTTVDSLGVSSNLVELLKQLVTLPGRVAGAVLP